MKVSQLVAVLAVIGGIVTLLLRRAVSRETARDLFASESLVPADGGEAAGDTADAPDTAESADEPDAAKAPDVPEEPEEPDTQNEPDTPDGTADTEEKE